MFRPLKIAAGIALILVSLPVAIVAGIFSKTRKCTPQELASDLNEIADGKHESWDRLESVPVQDPRLEAIRKEAVMSVKLPLRPEDQALLKQLAQKAAALS